MISADALQVYKQLDIGTAKPEAEILSRLPHHLIDLIDYTRNFNVGEFCLRADRCIRIILDRSLLPVISGGTAYYLKAWLLGLPETPISDPILRTDLERRWAGESDEALREEVNRIDPVSAGRIGNRDRYRFLRVLEVYAQTGRPLSEFPVSREPRKDYRVLSIGLRRERTELYRRIEQRVDLMLKAGLASEVADLREQGARREDPGMKAIGYREWFGGEGEDDPTVERVRQLITRNSRRYAKRQMTFFASLPDVRWFDAGKDVDIPGGIADTVREFLADDS